MTATQEDKHMLGSLELVDASMSVLILLMLQQYGYREVVMCKDQYQARFTCCNIIVSKPTREVTSEAQKNTEMRCLAALAKQRLHPTNLSSVQRRKTPPQP